MPTKVTLAAGGIVWRKAQSGSKKNLEVLVVHRPRYNDWTFPKGKADQDEPVAVTASREIFEESAVAVRLGHPLPLVSYRVRGGLKQVYYWSARLVGKSTAFEGNDEVDKIRWLAPREARRRLTYDHDRALLERFEELANRKLHRTRTLVVLRHAKARPREEHRGADVDRPLTNSGQLRAKNLVTLLQAFGVAKVFSSPATRCVETVEPYVSDAGITLKLDSRFSESANSAAVRRAVNELMESKKPTVVCTHRPTLPNVFKALNVPDVALEPGQALVIHHRKGKVHATELI